MPKTTQVKQVNMEQVIMTKVKTGEIAMKPRWYFVAGSIFMLLGLTSFSVVASFLTNLIFFGLRKHGPLWEWRLSQIISTFPWWLPVLAVIGMMAGIFFLRRYEFTYKRNFGLIIVGFVASIVMAAWLMDYLGLNESWSKQGPMRQFYQQLEGQDYPKGLGPGRGQGSGRGSGQNRQAQ